jgi:hypothetical protein
MKINSTDTYRISPLLKKCGALGWGPWFIVRGMF